MQAQLPKREQQKQFQVSDMVWSKLTGYPWWPGKITEIPKQNSGKYRVQFIGDNTHAFLPLNKLVHYTEGYDKYSTPQKIFKGFSAAVMEADILAANMSKPSDGSRGDYSQLKTVPEQQIQIFNQEASINNDAVSQQKNKQQKIEDSKEQKGTSRSRGRSQIRNRETKEYGKGGRKKQIEKRQKIVQKLLQNYHLDCIPEIDRKQNQNNTKMTKRRRKIIMRKSILQISNFQIRLRLICKISKILRKKNIIDSSIRRKIATFLGYSLISKKNDGVSGAHRALFQWLATSDYRTIESSYQNWETCADKIITGFTESNSIPDMKEQSQQQQEQ